MAKMRELEKLNEQRAIRILASQLRRAARQFPTSEELKDDLAAFEEAHRLLAEIEAMK